MNQNRVFFSFYKLHCGMKGPQLETINYHYYFSKTDCKGSCLFIGHKRANSEIIFLRAFQHFLVTLEAENHLWQ